MDGDHRFRHKCRPRAFLSQQGVRAGGAGRRDDIVGDWSASTFLSYPAIRSVAAPSTNTSNSQRNQGARPRPLAFILLRDGARRLHPEPFIDASLEDQERSPRFDTIGKANGADHRSYGPALATTRELLRRGTRPAASRPHCAPFPMSSRRWRPPSSTSGAGRSRLPGLESPSPSTATALHRTAVSSTSSRASCRAPVIDRAGRPSGSSR